MCTLTPGEMAYKEPHLYDVHTRRRGAIVLNVMILLISCIVTRGKGV